jgi:hypothetical protein
MMVSLTGYDWRNMEALPKATRILQEISRLQLEKHGISQNLLVSYKRFRLVTVLSWQEC